MACIALFTVACNHENLDPVPNPPTTTPTVDSLKIGLAAYYAFSNSTADSSASANNCTANNLTAIADRYSKANSAYYFNGTNAYAAAADNATLRLNNTDFTVSFWVKLDNYTANGSNVLSKHLSGNDQGWVIGINGTSSAKPGAVHFGPGGFSASASGTQAIPVNQWHMVTVTYNNTTKQLTIYIDGVLDNVTNNIPSPAAGITAMLYIGRDEPTASVDGYFVKGGIDEIRIYTRILPKSQIVKLCTPAPVQPPAPPVVDSLKESLLAYYQFNNNAADSSGNNNNGTISNLSAIADRNAKANAAYYFNGTDGYVTVPDKTPLRLNGTDFTLNFWIKLDNYTANGSNVLAKHLPGNDLGWVIGINGTSAAVPGAVHFGPGGYSASATGTKAIPLNQWHMVTATYSNATQKFSIYIDGVFDNVTDGIPSPNAQITSSLFIGRDEPTASFDGYFVPGGIDEVRIYGRILPATQIAKLLVNKN